MFMNKLGVMRLVRTANAEVAIMTSGDTEKQEVAVGQIFENFRHIDTIIGIIVKMRISKAFSQNKLKMLLQVIGNVFSEAVSHQE